MQTRLEKKPFYYGKRSSAETEVKWLASVFSLMDFSVMKKKPTVDFTEQPSNKYFVFRNGKCFHTKDCRIVKDAPVSALRSYTYYAAAVDAGFSPCMKCKPENLDKETAEIMRRINVKKQKEAREKYAAGQQPKKKRHRKKPDVFKSLSHMCALYGLKYEKSGKYVLITSDEGQYRIAPENESIELFRLENEDFVSLEKFFSDPYQAVREIVRLYECSKKQTADMGN